MPDHLHLLITPGEEASIEKAIQMVKGGSAFKIRKALNYKFPVWHEGYHDRWIRDLNEYQTRKHYIEQNPVKNRLVANNADYVFGSASGKFVLDMCKFDQKALGTDLQRLKPSVALCLDVVAEATTYKH